MIRALLASLLVIASAADADVRVYPSVAGNGTLPPTRRLYVVDLASERPTAENLGDVSYSIDTNEWCTWDGTWDCPAPGGGSPCDAWPVGSIFVSTSSTNPGTSLGCGTWSAYAAGRVLVGIDAGQSEFDVAGETGGAKTSTLTTSELPAHTHVVTSQTATTGSATSYEHGTLDTSSAEAEATEVTGSTGSGAAFSNLPPYVVVYFFRRSA